MAFFPMTPVTVSFRPINSTRWPTKTWLSHPPMVSKLRKPSSSTYDTMMPISSMWPASTRCCVPAPSSVAHELPVASASTLAPRADASSRQRRAGARSNADGPGRSSRDLRKTSDSGRTACHHFLDPGPQLVHEFTAGFRGGGRPFRMAEGTGGRCLADFLEPRLRPGKEQQPLHAALHQIAGMHNTVLRHVEDHLPVGGGLAPRTVELMGAQDGRAGLVRVGGPVIRAHGVAGFPHPCLSAQLVEPVSYTHLRAHETPEHLVCRLLLEKKKPTCPSPATHTVRPLLATR